MKYTKDNIDGVQFKTSKGSTRIYTISNVRTDGSGLRCTLHNELGDVASGNYNLQGLLSDLNSGHWPIHNKAQTDTYEIY